MNDITSYIKSKTGIATEPEVTPGAAEAGWQMFNTGGVEAEVGEFLYSLVRICKPKIIVETGTHLGISTAYMGLALQANNKGKIHTYEVIEPLRNQALDFWTRLEVTDQISSKLQSSLDAPYPTTRREIDMLFLDSEPQFRFDEFLKFWPRLKDGGFIVIHDLHPSLGLHSETYHGMFSWPYGDFRPKLGPLMGDFQVQVMHFPTPRGLTLFQRIDPAFESVKYMQSLYQKKD